MRRASYNLARRSNDVCRRRAFRTAAAGGDPPVQVTTLPNKIRVATESTPGHFSAVGLYVDAGSRYETPATSGVSHFLDRMAFQSTSNRSGEEMFAAVHSLGGQISCNSSRETILYQSSHFSQETPLALTLISDTVLNPKFEQQEIEAQRDAARYEVRELSAKPEMILPEVFHGVAYNHRGLGNPLLCPLERVDAIDGELLRQTMRDWYRPERMVLAGAGVQHEELVEFAEKHLSSLKPSDTSTISSNSPQPSLTKGHSIPSPNGSSVSKTITRAASYLFPNTLPSDPPLYSPSNPSYTGGHQYIFDASSEFNHLYVGFEGVGIHDDDVYVLATMQVLLGGGGSFSAGGPGKGMYSRLYTHILNHFPQIDHCASFQHIYADSSLFGLFASFVPKSSVLRGGNTPSQIMPHLVHQLALLLYSPVPKQELERAKNQLKSSLTMALESRAIQVEDLGRQILVHGRRVSATEMTDKIDQIQPDDIRRVATRVFGAQSGNKPTVICMGHEDTGYWQDVFRKYGVAGA